MNGSDELLDWDLTIILQKRQHWSIRDMLYKQY